MSDNKGTISGSCNCGSIKVTIPKPDGTVLCHCTSCRKSGGSLASANFALKRTDMEVTGNGKKEFTQKGSSGNDVTRHFCGLCGTPLWTSVADPNAVFVKGGLFETHSIPSPVSHLFAKNMEDWEVVHEGAERVETQ
ncbi:uncharacterized protein IL334_000022 [Kwoniella shivajii]|uniref:CENP-V/GFA domain-containing protein n=1 Tax=Kwoniella shivajii TaxID=564305 RepID=A0ABZ1CP06_9TREE|nr:hypothetical protein IL334_000022 [Kwoniella shivajii]